MTIQALPNCERNGKFIWWTCHRHCWAFGRRRLCRRGAPVEGRERKKRGGRKIKYWCRVDPLRLCDSAVWKHACPAASHL